MAQILLVEDDNTFAMILEGFLKKKSFGVEVKYSVKGGLEALSKGSFDLLLLDYRLGDGTGMDVLDAMHADGIHIPVIIMTSFNDVRTAVRAIRQGVFDYITKPVNPDELLMVVNEALESDTAAPDVKPRSRTVARATANGDYVDGTSAAARKMQEYISLVAPTDMTVLIRGESEIGRA